MIGDAYVVRVEVTPFNSHTSRTTLLIHHYEQSAGTETSPSIPDIGYERAPFDHKRKRKGWERDKVSKTIISACEPIPLPAAGPPPLAKLGKVPY